MQINRATSGSHGPGLYCDVIVKTVDAQTRAKTGINKLLRDQGAAAGKFLGGRACLPSGFAARLV